MEAKPKFTRPQFNEALKAWQARVEAREAVGRAMAKARDFIGVGLQGAGRDAAAARSVLFGQRARA